MINYFEVYGLPIKYALDLAALKKTFYERSRLLHPDQHSAEIPAAQAEALRLASLNNDAYKTLSDPWKRLQHLLVLFELMDAAGQTGRQLDASFLMEMMDINEQMEALRASPDPEQVVRAQAEIEGRLSQLEHDILATMQAFDVAAEPTRNELLAHALEAYLQRKYLLRLQETVANFAPHSPTF